MGRRVRLGWVNYIQGLYFEILICFLPCLLYSYKRLEIKKFQCRGMLKDLRRETPSWGKVPFENQLAGDLKPDHFLRLVLFFSCKK